ncbi:hypothetical protein HHK36_009360 [Tetracentron sinense]|uniref:DUF674 family protein n=1 Tax=Tetracentron sinense TaxID=13715 RepID=A0A834ZF37_TETSI|nr:hypothetical protein HHK36_009360 [Tetracentron sinense]
MAKRQLQSINMKILVEKEKERILFAESDSDFMDILFSFLTMPIGTIVRLTSCKLSASEIGCMNNLYKSVDKLDVQHLWTAACKTMLLCPRNSAENHCRNLKVNIDDTKPIQYYTCSSASSSHPTNDPISTYENVRCPWCCGKMMTTSVQLRKPNATKVAEEDNKRVFLKDSMRFMMRDGLQLLDLLMSLFSKTPLTDAILLKKVTVDQIAFDSRNTTQLIDARDADCNVKVFKLKLVVSKSNKKVLYAEAREDFVDLVLSFLTFPLGSIVELFGGNSPLQSLNTLYKSVEELSENYIKSKEIKDLLLHPKLPSYFGCENQLLPIQEVVKMYYYTFNCTSCYPILEISTSENEASRQCQHHKKRLTFKVVNPKLPTGDSIDGGGFVKSTEIFMVTDDLVVTPFSLISAISLLSSLKVAISDVEERVVNVSKKEFQTGAMKPELGSTSNGASGSGPMYDAYHTLSPSSRTNLHHEY